MEKKINLVILLLYFVLINSSVTAKPPTGWEVVDRRPEINPEIKISNYSDIKCADSLNCIIWARYYGVGGFYFRRTTDGGMTWKNVYNDSAYYHPPDQLYRVAQIQEISYPDTNLFMQ